MHSTKSRSCNRVGGSHNPGRPYDKGWNDTKGSGKEEALKKIAALRRKIDKIDEEILLLLKERLETSKKMGKIKQRHRIPVRDPEREEEKYKQITEKALKLMLNPEDVKDLYRKIIDMSVRAQEQ